MDGNETTDTDGNLKLEQPSHNLKVAIAISGSKKSKSILRWVLEKFVPEGIVFLKLIHVRARLAGVPTAMGNMIPISQVREDVAAAFIKEVEWRTNEMLVPYKNMCFLHKVQVEAVVIESDDVPSAIATEVAKSSINKLVIGAPSSWMFTRKLKGLSSKISASTPSFCTVYAVSKGKLSSVRPSDLEIVGSSKDDNSDTCSITSSSSYASRCSQTDCGSVSSSSQSHTSMPSLPIQRFQALATINQTLLKTSKNSTATNHYRYNSLDSDELNPVLSSCPSNSYVNSPLSQASSLGTLLTDNQSLIYDQALTSNAVADYPSTERQLNGQTNIDFELEKLRIELRHARGMNAMARSETNEASRKINNLNKRRLEETIKLKEIIVKEEEAKEVARQEKEKHEAARREAQLVSECVEREAAIKREAEMKAMHDCKEKKKFESTLMSTMRRYQKFTWEEIVSATSSFSEDLKIEMGGYGTIYKGTFHHTTTAVKVLHSEESPKTKQFQQELDILSKIRHPHLLLLLGACPEYGCLVYEYMENSSLEDRLMQKNNTPPIPWFDRFRIAWEIASALVFLHNSKPKPIIHCDLKPANILLDHNLVSKIGDVGLAAMLQSDPSSVSIMYRDTEPVGTLCYIDPEYQRTGLISTKSDVYAFGMVILQLLTAKPAIALAHVVETAVSEGLLMAILDPKAGNWPTEESKQLAELGLSCVELRRKDRPDLNNQVLPVLERLKEVADKAKRSASTIQLIPPNHFICPILKDVMNEPCVAADGYTYDRKAIEMWLETNNSSPMTNLALPNKNLIPNYTLLSAIIEWKSSEHVTLTCSS